MRALRRGGREEDFGVQIAELESYFEAASENQAVRAIPGMGIEVPVYILGSSLYSAHLAAKIGRPYAFASHFAPGDLLQALDIYRNEFKPSKKLAKPYAMVGVPAFAAPTDEEAQFLASSMVLRSLSIFRGQRRPLPPPVERIEWSQSEQMLVAERMSLMVIGGPQRVANGLQKIIDATGADELIVVSDAFRHEDRMRSYEIVMQSKRGAGSANA